MYHEEPESQYWEHYYAEIKDDMIANMPADKIGYIFFDLSVKRQENVIKDALISRGAVWGFYQGKIAECVKNNVDLTEMSEADILYYIQDGVSDLAEEVNAAGLMSVFANDLSFIEHPIMQMALDKYCLPKLKR